MKRGLFIGRFQPFHNGHLEVIKYIAGEVDELIIGIGSADSSHSLSDPFTAGERIVMIQRALSFLQIPYYIIPIQDTKRNAIWVAHIKSLSPSFDTVFSSNPLVIQLFSEEGFVVKSPPMHFRKELSGTLIREKMLAGFGWEDLVPAETVRVIQDIKGIERMQVLSKSDK